jgi:hypothetical protein
MPRRRLFARDVSSLLLPTQQVTFDAQYAAWAESLELAMVELYNAAVLRLGGDHFTMATLFRDHHQAHAEAYGALSSGTATGKPNSVLIFTKMPGLQAQPDEASLLTYLLSLENQMAETYAYGLSGLNVPDVYDRVIATLPIESQHAAVLGAVLQLGIDALFITGAFENASVGDGTDARRGFDMASFPIG